MFDKTLEISRNEFLKLSALLPAGLYFGTHIPILTSREKIGGVNYLNQGVIERFDTEKKVMVLSIDDGWLEDDLREFLDVLRAKKVHATLFLVGMTFGKESHQKLIRQAAIDGHEIAYHSVEHAEMPITESMNLNEWVKDYEEWLQRIRAVLGAALFSRSVKRYARAPGGAFTYAFLEMCRRKRLIAFGWSSGPQSVNRQILPKPGDIYLAHFRYQDLALLERITNNEFGLKPISIGEFFEIEMMNLDSKSNSQNEVNMPVRQAR